MKLAIIGAGVAGLISVKYGLDEGHECDVYEQTGEIGGLWVYHDEIVDEHGVPISSPLYEEMCTNIPKEGMAFLDFPYPEMKESFIKHSHVLEYLRKFSNYFDLERHIKFHTRVTEVRPIADTKWSITIRNVKTQKEESKKYDAVFVCTGHYSVANFPEIPGQDIFKGTQIHSMYFRKAAEYKDKRVLIVGGFVSAVDISRIISEVSEHVFISHHGEYMLQPGLEVIRKPAVLRLEKDGAVFVDESKESIDAVIYCTGYEYSFPFLTKDCGIRVSDKWIRPLYKHIINIEYPTMYFIGMVDYAFPVPTCDLQARFALASLKQHFRLPTREAMIKELDEYMMTLQEMDLPLSFAHRLVGPVMQPAYFQDLATTADIKPIPNVVNNIFDLLVLKKTEARYFLINEENVIPVN